MVKRGREPFSSPDAVVFDFDGVLVDSEPLHLLATQHALAQRGITMTRDDYYARYVGYDDAGMFAQLAIDRGLIWCSDDLQAMIAAKALRFAELEASEALLVPGAAACVRRMADVAPLAVASGARRDEIERILARLGLAPLFRTIVAAGETASGKPAPDPYLEAASRRREAGGLRCIGVTTTFPAAKLTLADRIVDSLDAITVDLVLSII